MHPHTSDYYKQFINKTVEVKSSIQGRPVYHIQLRRVSPGPLGEFGPAIHGYYRVAGLNGKVFKGKVQSGMGLFEIKGIGSIKVINEKEF